MRGFVPTEVNPSGQLQDNDYYFRAVPIEILEREGKYGIDEYYRRPGGARIEMFWFEHVAVGNGSLSLMTPSGQFRFGSHDWIGNTWTFVHLPAIEITGATWALSIGSNTNPYPVGIQFRKTSRPASVRQDIPKQLSFGQFKRTSSVLFQTQESLLPVLGRLTSSVQLEPQNVDEQITLYVKFDLTPSGIFNAIPFVPLFTAGTGIPLFLQFKLTVGFGNIENKIIRDAGITTHEFGEYDPQTIVVHPCHVNYRYVIFELSGNHIFDRTLTTRCTRSWERSLVATS
jgi:hypothetical protein